MPEIQSEFLVTKTLNHKLIEKLNIDMKKIFSLLFVMLITISAWAQKTISGKITDSDGQGIPSASVTIEEVGSDAILAYGISNAKGEYKVTFTTAATTVGLKVKAYNQKPITRNVSNETQTLNYGLESEATEIKEVKITTKLITKRGDTISYDLKSFESKADRSLGDVLKKMPGIEVQSNGTILYQGEPLNKFYVNGKDLMEGGYGSITNALPKDAVSKVEVLENHQPVKILQDKISSESAAINIKLKSKVTMTGRGEVGVGMDPFLWNVKLTPMFFGQKNQWVVNYKANNNGESVEREGNMLAFGNRFEGRRRQASQKSWMNIETASTPGIPEKRYLLNNVHYFSANLLTNPFTNKDWELKANVSYTNNAVEREDNLIQEFEVGSSRLPEGGTLTSQTKNNFYTNAAKGELIFSKNAKKGFFKNTTTWNGFWNDSNAFTDVYNYIPPVESTTPGVPSTPGRFDYFSSDQFLNSPSGSFQNSLSTIIPWKEKMVNFMSYVSYQTDKQTMDILPASYTNMNGNLPVADQYETLRQFAKSTTLIANHSASVGFTHKFWTFTPEVGLNMSFNNLESTLFGKNGNTLTGLGNDYVNDMDWNEVMPYTQLGINYKNSNFNLNVTLPFNFYGITYKDQLRNQTLDNNKLAFEPNLFATYDFASFFKLWGFASQSYNYGSFGFLYGGEMLTSPLRATMRYDYDNPMMPKYVTRNIGSRLEYRNPLNNLFFNIRYNYNTNDRNLIERFTGQGMVSTLSLLAIDNNTISRSQGAEIGKYFPKFKSNLSVTFNNTNSNGFTYFNEMQRTSTERQSLGLKFNNTYFSWLSLDYNINMNWASNINKNMNTNVKSSGWNHNLAAYLYPIENHTIGFFWDDLSTSARGESFRNSFYDLSYQYTWAKKKIDFEVKWLNIANRKVYETISYSPEFLMTSRNMMYIRPSQVMFTVKFNFK